MVDDKKGLEQEKLKNGWVPFFYYLKSFRLEVKEKWLNKNN